MFQTLLQAWDAGLTACSEQLIAQGHSGWKSQKGQKESPSFKDKLFTRSLSCEEFSVPKHTTPNKELLKQKESLGTGETFF